ARRPDADEAKPGRCERANCRRAGSCVTGQQQCANGTLVVPVVGPGGCALHRAGTGVVFWASKIDRPRWVRSVGSSEKPVYEGGRDMPQNVNKLRWVSRGATLVVVSLLLAMMAGHSSAQPRPGFEI